VFIRILTSILVILSVICTQAYGKTVIIGLSLGLTGKYSEMGKMQKRGLLLWETHVNRKGGLLGNPVKITIKDDQSRPEKAREIYTDLIENQKVDLVIGPYSSAVSEAILPVTEKNKYPILLSGASADRLWEKGYQYAFGVYTPASKYTVGFLQLLVKRGLKKISIVSADDAFSASLAMNTQKWANRFLLSVVSFDTFKKGKKDLKAFAMKAQSAEAEAVVVCGHLDESVNMRKALKSIGWHPKAYYASVGPATDKYKTLLDQDVDLTFSSSQWEQDVGIHFPQGNKFIQTFKKQYQTLPSYHAATAYAAGMILEAAFEKSNSLDRESLRQTLSNLNTMTLIGRYGVDKNGKQQRHFPLIIQWQNGTKQVVWPEKIKETNAIIQ